MDTLRAFAMGMANRGRPLMVFDWDEAALRIVASGAGSADAGLRSDWEWTGGNILSGGVPKHGDYTYLASTWATPELRLDGGDREACYVMEDEAEKRWPDADFAELKWPESALVILRSGGTDTPNITGANE